MKKAIMLAALVIGAAGLVQCGDDDSSPPVDASITSDSGAGGRSDAAASVGGNRAGAGGSTVADASQGDASQGGTTSPGMGGASIADGAAGGTDASAGGSPGVGGVHQHDAGTGGARADADAGPVCPTQAPTDFTTCSDPSTNECVYGTVSCRCRSRDSKWWCVNTALAADAGCSAEQPTDNKACRQTGLNCQVGAQSCRCNSGNGTTGQRWTCTTKDASDDTTPDVVTPDATPDVQVDAQPDVATTDAAADGQ